MITYTINEFLELLDNKKLSLIHILNLREKLNKPFKRHPLGFYACTLFEEHSRKIRLHYWDSSNSKEVQSSELMIHDHIFDFKSWILSGSIENIEYEIDEKGQVYHLYSTFYEKDCSILEKTTESIKILEKNIQVYENGQSYNMKAGVLHKTRTIQDKTFTVLYTEDTERVVPRVLARDLAEKKIVYERKEITEQEINEKFNSIYPVSL